MESILSVTTDMCPIMNSSIGCADTMREGLVYGLAVCSDNSDCVSETSGEIVSCPQAKDLNCNVAHASHDVLAQATAIGLYGQPMWEPILIVK